MNKSVITFLIIYLIISALLIGIYLIDNITINKKFLLIGIITIIAGFIYPIFQYIEQKKNNFKEGFRNKVNDYKDFVNNIRYEVYMPQQQPLMTKGDRFFTLLLHKTLKECYTDNRPQMYNELLEEDGIKEINELASNDLASQKKDKLKVFLSQMQNNAITQKPSFELQTWIYEYFHGKHDNILTPYFNKLYNIFEYVINSSRNKQRKEEYIDSLHSEMTIDEIVLLFYYAISKYGKNKNGSYQFKGWLKEYDFFANIDYDRLLNKNDINFYYD